MQDTKMIAEKAEPVSAAAADMVLEPLSQATRTATRKLDLRPTDYLFLWLDREGRKFFAQVRCCDRLESGKLEQRDYPGPSPQATQFFQRLPEAKWLGQRDESLRHRWHVAATDFSALVISAAWPQDRVIFSAGPDFPTSADARDTFKYLVRRFFLQNDRAAHAAAFKLEKKVPPLPEDWVEHEDLPPSDYQRAASVFGVAHDATAYFMDRGTGKTFVAIHNVMMRARRKMRKTGKMYRAIVVCPRQVCLNWQLEIERFATTQGKVAVVRGGPLERAKTLIQAVTTEEDCVFSAVIVSYDLLVASADHFARVKWDEAISDESHMFKSSATDRWKAMRKLRESAVRRTILTGTPVGNSPMDLWTQLEFLGEGLSGFQDYKEFRNFHGVWSDPQGFSSGIQRLLAVKNVPLLQERLARLSFAITKEEAGLNLPDKVYDAYEVAMTKDQAEIYERVAEDLAVEIENKLSGEVNQLTVENILTSLLRLAQITSGFVTWDAVVDPLSGDVLRPRRIEQISEANPKLEALVELLQSEENDPLGKTIVWCCFVEDIKRILSRLKIEGIEAVDYYGGTPQSERDEIVRRFNCDPAVKVMVANPQTAGEGLDLLGYDKINPEDSPTYVDHEIFFSQNWSAILRSQAEDRAHRRGTRMPVRITDLVVPGTIDEEIRRRVKGKQDMAMSLVDVREILRNVLRIGG